MNALGSLGAQDAEVAFEVADGHSESVVFQLSGTFAGTVVLEATAMNDPSPTYVAIQITNLNSGTAAGNATAAGLYRADLTGIRKAKVRCSAYTSGTIVVNVRTARNAS